MFWQVSESGLSWVECLGGWKVLKHFSSVREFCYLSTPAPYEEQKKTCQKMGGSLAELGTDLDIDKFSYWIKSELAELRSNKFSVGGLLNIFGNHDRTVCLSGLVRSGVLVWDQSGKKIPFHPGSYFSPGVGDESWKNPAEDVTDNY